MEKKQKSIAMMLMIVYLLLLSWVIVFKANMNTIYFMFAPEFRNINLIPTFNMRETLLNILAFIPLGIYVKMLAARQSALMHTLIIASVSLLYEIIQYVLAVGTSDITDVISNTVGGIIGLIVYFLLAKLLKGKTEKACTILACVGTILLMVFVFRCNI